MKEEKSVCLPFKDPNWNKPKSFLVVFILLVDLVPVNCTVMKLYLLLYLKLLIKIKNNKQKGCMSQRRHTIMRMYNEVKANNKTLLFKYVIATVIEKD